MDLMGYLAQSRAYVASEDQVLSLYTAMTRRSLCLCSIVYALLADVSRRSNTEVLLLLQLGACRTVYGDLNLATAHDGHEVLFRETADGNGFVDLASFPLRYVVFGANAVRSISLKIAYPPVPT